MRHTLVGLSCLVAISATWGLAGDAKGGPAVDPSAGLAVVAAAPMPPDWPYQHFRVAQPRARALVQSAWERSRTIRGLLDRLESSNVLTFFAISPFLQLPTGRTSFISMAGRFRCLNLVLNERNGEDDLIALLGHELHHVLEVAEAPEVRDVSSYERLYQRIGTAWMPGMFETPAAVEVWRQVRRDLAGGNGGEEMLVV